MPYADKEKQKAYNKAYQKKYNKRPNAIKSLLIRRWVERGLIVNDIDALYDKYLNTTNCELCNVKLCGGNKAPNRKCMDHDHTTGHFRNIICNTCNATKLDNALQITNTTGIKNIIQIKNTGNWAYQKRFNKKRFSFTNKNKQIVLWVKFVDYLILSQQ